MTRRRIFDAEDDDDGEIPDELVGEALRVWQISERPGFTVRIEAAIDNHETVALARDLYDEIGLILSMEPRGRP